VLDIEKMMGVDEKDNEKQGNRIMSLMILSCYNSVTLQKGRDVWCIFKKFI